VLDAALLRIYSSFERLNRWSRLRLTRLGAVVAGGALCVGVLSVDMFQTLAYQVSSLLAGALAVSWLGALRFRPALRVQRNLPDYATVGMLTTFSLRIENLAQDRAQQSLSISDRLATASPSLSEYRNARDAAGRDTWFDRLVGLRRWLRLAIVHRGANIEPADLPLLPAGARINVPITLVPVRRGILLFESTVMQRPDPLGLVNALSVVRNPQTLLVLPRRFRVPDLALGAQRRYQPGGMNLAGNVGDSREFLSLRDYCAGDPLRHVHWRSWARTGRPIVKQYHDEFFNRQALILDTFGEGGPAFEDAISLAASFLLNRRESDALTDLMLVDTRAIRAQAGRGLGSSAHLLEMLACAQPAPPDDFGALHQLVGQHSSRLSGAIVVLLGWDEKRQALIGHLLAARVSLWVVIVRSADAAGKLEPGPMRAQAGRMAVVRTGHVEEDLAALSTSADPQHPKANV